MKCITENCDETLSPLSKLDRCPKCRANVHSWERREPDEVLERCKDLARYADRMSIVSVRSRRPNNVVSFKKYAKSAVANARTKQRARR